MSQLKTDRKQIIKNALQLSDISICIGKYEYYFEGRRTGNIKNNRYSTTVSSLLSKNRIIIGSWMNTKLSIWNLNTQKVESVFETNEYPRIIIPLSENRILLLKSGCYCSVWNIKTFTNDNFPIITKAYKYQFELLSDGYLGILGDRQLLIWDLNQQKMLDPLILGNSFQMIKYIGNHKLVVAFFDIEIWDLKTREKDLFLRGTGCTTIRNVEKLLNNRLLCVEYENIQVYDLETQKVNLLHKSKVFITQVLLLEDERLIIARRDYTVELLDLKSGQIISTQKFNIGEIKYIKKLHGNEILFASRYGTLGIWNSENYEFRNIFETYDEFNNLEVSAEGEVIVSLPGEVFEILQ